MYTRTYIHTYIHIHTFVRIHIHTLSLSPRPPHPPSKIYPEALSLDRPKNNPSPRKLQNLPTSAIIKREPELSRM